MAEYREWETSSQIRHLEVDSREERPPNLLGPTCPIGYRSRETQTHYVFTNHKYVVNSNS